MGKVGVVTASFSGAGLNGSSLSWSTAVCPTAYAVFFCVRITAYAAISIHRAPIRVWTLGRLCPLDSGTRVSARYQWTKLSIHFGLVDRSTLRLNLVD